MISMRSKKARLSEVSPMSPFKWVHCSFDWRWPSFVLSRKIVKRFFLPRLSPPGDRRCDVLRYQPPCVCGLFVCYPFLSQIPCGSRIAGWEGSVCSRFPTPVRTADHIFKGSVTSESGNRTLTSLISVIEFVMSRTLRSLGIIQSRDSWTRQTFSFRPNILRSTNTKTIIYNKTAQLKAKKYPTSRFHR